MKFDAGAIMKEGTLFIIVPWLVISSLLLFPVGRMAEVPLALLALIGLKVFVENIKEGNWNKSTLFFSLFFLCLWLPIIFSIPDSYKVSKTSSLAIEYLRFILAGLAVLKYCSTIESFKRINKYCLFIISFWIFDALIQYVAGTDLFGYPVIPQRLNGIFGQTIKLGLFLAVYSSFVFLFLYEKRHLVLGGILNLLCFIVLLLAGSRGGWIMYGVILIGFISYKWRNNLKLFITSGVILTVGLLTISTVLYYNSDSFSKKMDTTLEIFKGDEESIDRAISYRLSIWKAATSMISSHPVNGVGARAFRYAYLDFAEDDDIFLRSDFAGKKREIGAYHSHQMQLEVLSETGLIGGFLFLCAMAILVWYWRSKADFQKFNMLPYALGLAAIFFPFNTHFSLYSSAWAQVIYWFIPLYFAAGSIQSPLPDPDGKVIESA
jgi:O-antigen ligase